MSGKGGKPRRMRTAPLGIAIVLGIAWSAPGAQGLAWAPPLPLSSLVPGKKYSSLSPARFSRVGILGARVGGGLASRPRTWGHKIPGGVCISSMPARDASTRGGFIPATGEGGMDGGEWSVEVCFDGKVCIRNEASLYAKEIGVVERGDLLRVVASETVHGSR